MEKEIDRIAKEILANSELRLYNSSFNSKVIQQIITERQRQVRKRATIGFLIGLLLILSCVQLLVNVFDINLSEAAAGSGIIPHFVISAFENTWKLISGNQYIVIIAGLLVIGKWFDKLLPASGRTIER